ncbi:MAG: tRNA (adenosine(37)-N6)-dimethylallyltransferase MiaA [Flavobacteriales bacterium]|nr:tRNA (adenosine(37)-N6)-dimethylallyltransferase MiaA [Flavobacteriales bacterium]
MSSMSTNTLWVVLGPTAIGKTALGIQLAQKLNTEIISCDSRQFYKEMRIGTAVPSTEELESVPHHFMQHISIHQEYSVGCFEKESLKKLEELLQTKQHAVLVGGSGLYIDAVCKGLDKFPDIKPELREKIRTNYNNKGLAWLQQEVQKNDPEYYQIVDTQNAYRLLRCLEVCLQSRKTFTSFRKQKTNTRPFNIKYIGLQMPREELYLRINQRVDSMMKEGLLEEAKALLPHQHLNALQTVGYRELFAHLNGEHTLEKAVELIKQNTRRFAKRQLTWLKKYENAKWFDSAKEAIKKIQ